MKLKTTRIAFIGAGNMAEALVRGLVSSGVCASDRICVADIDAKRRDHLAEAYGVAGFSDNGAAVSGAGIVILAVKPQVMGAVLRDLRGAMPEDALVISIAAGIPTSRIEAALKPGQRVVRVMPNTPSLVGAGAAAIAPGSHAVAEDEAATEQLLGAVGLVVRVTEDQLDAVTALSGSGPAYIFYFMETMVRTAEGLGLSEDIARDLTIATVRGAAQLLDETGEDPAILRARVTSKGGTTEAALKVMEDEGVAASFAVALRAAHERSCALSKLTD